MQDRKNEHFLDKVVNYLDIFGAFDEGVIITDHTGRIMFYNDTQARIDSVVESPVGEMITEFYQLDSDTSLVMNCLATQRPVLNRHLIYKTRLGRTANAICSVFPLIGKEGLIGAACFVREYNLLEATITSASTPGPQPSAKSPTDTRFSFGDIIGESKKIKAAIKTAKMAALTPSPVMMIGETGSGKEVFVQAMHQFGPRKNRTCVAINCAAIPENLLEGILFGTVRGAFTGAVDKPGLFEKADGGTLFLDEINSMPLGLQAKLLRVVQEKRFRRVGSLDERVTDVKILSSINEDPHVAIEKRRLRVDLFYRLGVVLLHLPSLRERREDVTPLVHFFIEKFNRSLGRNVEGLTDRVVRLFETHSWPGNVRELEHVIEGAMNVVGNRRQIDRKDLPPHLRQQRTAPALGIPVTGVSGGAVGEGLEGQETNLLRDQSENERKQITDAMAHSRGNVSRAAVSLGLSRQLLHYKLRKYKMKREDFKG
jgi:arginine utilization regulatory protein